MYHSFREFQFYAVKSYSVSRAANAIKTVNHVGMKKSRKEAANDKSISFSTDNRNYGLCITV